MRFVMCILLTDINLTNVPQYGAHDLDILLSRLLLLVEVVEDNSEAEPGPVHVVVEVLIAAHVSVLLNAEADLD